MSEWNLMTTLVRVVNESEGKKVGDGIQCREVVPAFLILKLDAGDLTGAATCHEVFERRLVDTTRVELFCRGGGCKLAVSIPFLAKQDGR